ncbi:hypothetical protein SLE2022_008390 [Rubroshorea leprosula]
MKYLSFFLLKNSLGAKMRKGIRNFCNSDASTSTLDQHNPDRGGAPSCIATPGSLNNTGSSQSPPTLEEMILQLELEEEIARKEKLNEYAGIRPGRMSCVNNSDILRSARNALNQYPRFSLDGKDAMYRSSFRNFGIQGGRRSVCCDQGLAERFCRLPPKLAGESVVWCKPGVVAKLMGLDAIPVPVTRRDRKEKLSTIIKRQNLRRRAERHELERKLAVDMTGCATLESCSRTGYCVLNPVVLEPANGRGGGWPTRKFL